MNHAEFTSPKTLDLVFEIGERQARTYEYSPILVPGNSKTGHVGLWMLKL